MNENVLIINSSELIAPRSDKGKPLRGKKLRELDIIKDGAVFISNGRIKDFGKTKFLIEKYNNSKIIDALGSVVMPGLIDPHTHLVFAGSREEEFLLRLRGEDYLKVLNEGGGILSTVSDTRKASFDELYELSYNRIKKMISYGTLALEIKSGYGLNLEDEVKILSVIAKLKEEFDIPIKSTLLAAHALPQEFAGNKNAYIDFICEVIIPNVAKRGIADFNDAFCEKDVFDVEDCRKILQTGLQYGLKPKLHTDEFYSLGGISLGRELNAISLDHLVNSKIDELKKLSESETIAVILPGTYFGLRECRTNYAREIIDSNIPLAIGTDFNPGTCMCYSMQTMIELSVLKLDLLVEEAINAATVNAAFALCLQDEAGSLEENKRGNFIFLDIKNYKEIPYIWGTNKVYKVVINGKEVNLFS
ncbi:MAG TPA: imidazolonepropionase [Caldisericia bacterium]|nr:imidazolonepropionase [Caldisericia bacterium]